MTRQALPPLLLLLLLARAPILRLHFVNHHRHHCHQHSHITTATCGAFLLQVRYYEVSEDELERLRTDFANGRLDIKIEQATFNVHEYNEVCVCVSVSESIAEAEGIAGRVQRASCGARFGHSSMREQVAVGCADSSGRPRGCHHPLAAPPVPSSICSSAAVSWLPLASLQFMKGVAGEYEELRQRQRVAMAEQMALDAEMLKKLDARQASGMHHAVSWPCLLRLAACPDPRAPCSAGERLAAAGPAAAT